MKMKFTPEEYGKKARAYFEQGYNCSQAVLLSFGDITGLDEETAARLSSSFGGGMGRLREVCGAASGVFMAAGLVQGYSNPEASDEKAAHYAFIQSLAADFKAQNGSIICRELLGLPGASDPVPEERTQAYYQRRPCADYVESAAKILAAKLSYESCEV